MSDPHFGHRDILTGFPRGDADEWTTWDLALINAYQLMQDWTNEHGLLVYEVDDHKERVDVIAKPKIDKFEAQKDIKTRRQKQPPPGQYFVPDVSLRKGAEWPTLEEYIEAELEKDRLSQEDE